MLVPAAAANGLGAKGREGEVTGHPLLQLRQREPPSDLATEKERERERERERECVCV